MIDFMVTVRRRFYPDFSAETVQSYLEELLKCKEDLHGFSLIYQYNLFGSPELLKEVNSLIDETYLHSFSAPVKLDYCFDLPVCL